MLIAEFDEREGWAEWGVNSCAHWLSWRCSITPRTARDHVRVARSLAGLPLIREAFGRGELTYSKVRALARIATEETEESLLEIARHATGAQLEKLVRGYHGALMATIDAARLAHDRRFLSCQWDEDGSLRLNARLTADEGALVLAALKAAEEPRDEERDWAQVRADALVSIARSALASEPGDRARPGGDPCELIIHVDSDSLAGERIIERSELADGPPLAPETVRRLGCDAAIVRILERDGQPLTVGRRTRSIPPALRRALCSRDQGCRFPGCGHRRFLHAHHIRHWARGGTTELGNLVQLCSYHHRLVHEGGFRVERSEPGGLRFRRPDGRRIVDVPQCGAVAGPGLIRQHRLEGLSLHSDTCRPLSAGDRIDYGLAVEVLLVRARGSPLS
jgi:Domain of unknown function (DUF222)/HNH endonuclease